MLVVLLVTGLEVNGPDDPSRVRKHAVGEPEP
jgi:hypothetical protein